MSRVIKQYRFFCETEGVFKTVWDTASPPVCPVDPGHAVDPDSITVLDTIDEIVTRSEQDRTVNITNDLSSAPKGVSGTWHDGVERDVLVTPFNELKVNFPVTAFGNLAVAEATPEIQVDYRNGILQDSVDIDTAGSGSVTGSNSMAVVDCGAAAASSACVRTKRFVRYAAGQGALVMFTAIFDPPAAGNVRLVGCGTDEDGFFFGYHGTQFGILKRRGGVDEWTYQTDWNFDVMDGGGSSGQTFDATKGNVYRIQFQWLGFGMIRFYMENTSTGEYCMVHRIQYANTETVPTIFNPSFPIVISSENTTNDTALTVRSASCYGCIEGKRQFLGPTFSIDNLKVADSKHDVENMLTVRNKPVFNGGSHYTPVLLKMVSVGSEGSLSRVVTVYIIKNAAVSGTQTWTDVDSAASVMEYDSNGEVLTGGNVLLSFVIRGQDSRVVDLSSAQMELEVNDTVSVGCRLSKVGSNDITCSLVWLEDR